MIWHAIVWTLTGLCAAVWSLLVWAVHALVTGPDWRALGDGAWMDWLMQWRLPAWLGDWVPLGAVGELQAWLAMLGPWVESLLAHAPGVLAWVTPVLWLGWALGLLVLVLLGVAGSVLVVAIRAPALARRQASA